jgi:DivIVA domain-containing protein
MATDFIDKLRTAAFPTARRGGYDTDAVDAYLRELADWLETGGDDQTRAALVQREMERVGERTGSVLAAAQQTADDVLAEARAEAKKLRDEAEREAAELRSGADSYSTETRSAADEHVRITAEAAASQAADMRKSAETEARAKIEEAERRLQEATEEAAKRTAGVEREIAALVEKREAILANLQELASGIKGTVEGPGVADLDLPEKLLEQAKVTEESAEHAIATPEPVAEPEADIEETRIAEQEVAETQLLEEDEPEFAEPVADEEPTDESPLGDAGDEVEDFDTEEQERVREREIARRRNPGSSSEPPTEDSSLTDLL